jgi:hypothetical protein
MSVQQTVKKTKAFKNPILFDINSLKLVININYITLIYIIIK